MSSLHGDDGGVVASHFFGHVYGRRGGVVRGGRAARGQASDRPHKTPNRGYRDLPTTGQAVIIKRGVKSSTGTYLQRAKFVCTAVTSASDRYYPRDGVIAPHIKTYIGLNKIENTPTLEHTRTPKTKKAVTSGKNVNRHATILGLGLKANSNNMIACTSAVRKYSHFSHRRYH